MRVPFTATLQTSANEWLSFRDPVLVLQADSADAVRRTIADVEQLTRDRGLHAVGFLAYEAGAAFGLSVAGLQRDLPLAWFGLFQPASVTRVGRPVRSGDYALGLLEPSVTRQEFARAFATIKARIAAGDTYQVNYTFRLRGTFEGDPFDLFADLADAQRGRYSAYLDLGDMVICSASPELFFEFDGAEIRARPMKGTARRGRTPEEDRAAGAALAASPKDRAENVMVVDMVRNDLGRVAQVGSVDVPELFEVERFPNVWQMTSLVRARTLAPLDEVFAALHPSASITGAPKVRTMELLAELEREPRGVYTGAIGHVPPDGNARFNVAIRTAVVDRRVGHVTFGVGSGIVWDSNADAEYDECLLKGSVLGRRPVDFELLETLRWTPDEGFYLLERHLARIAESGEYFGVPIVADRIQSALSGAVSGATCALRVRLLVDGAGGVRVEHRPHVPWREPVRVRLARTSIDTADVFLYHKTTHRRVYEEARSAAGECDDVLLWNERGEVTEGTIANVIIQLDGRRVTPPVSSGLLAGTCRAEMLERGDLTQSVVRVDDLRRAERMWLINSVQGMRLAELSE